MAEITPNSRRYARVSLKAFAAVGPQSGAGAAGKEDIYKEYNATCINISEGGCCLQLAALLSGADIDFGVKAAIELSDGQPRLVVNGKIAWLKELNADVLERYLIGIEFQGLNPQDKERISRFIQSQSNTKQ